MRKQLRFRVPCIGFPCGKTHVDPSPQSDKEPSYAANIWDSELALTSENDEESWVATAPSHGAEPVTLPTLLQASKPTLLKPTIPLQTPDVAKAVVVAAQEPDLEKIAVPSSLPHSKSETFLPLGSTDTLRSAQSDTAALGKQEPLRLHSRRFRRNGTTRSDSAHDVSAFRNRSAFFLMRTTTFIKRRKNTGSRAVARYAIPSKSVTFELVEPKRPQNQQPIAIHHLRGVTVAGLRAAMEGPFDKGPFKRFLREVLGCKDIVAEPWMESLGLSGTMAQRIRYVMPVPRDLPDSVARFASIPETVMGTTFSFMSAASHEHEDDELIVVQRSFSEGVLYSNRLRVQHTFSFRPHPSGGVQCRQWAESIWLEQLPWTHRFITNIVAKKVQAEAIATAPDLARILEGAVSASIALETSGQN